MLAARGLPPPGLYRKSGLPSRGYGQAGFAARPSRRLRAAPPRPSGVPSALRPWALRGWAPGLRSAAAPLRLRAPPARQEPPLLRAGGPKRGPLRGSGPLLKVIRPPALCPPLRRRGRGLRPLRRGRGLEFRRLRAAGTPSASGFDETGAHPARRQCAECTRFQRKGSHWKSVSEQGYPPDGGFRWPLGLAGGGGQPR